MIDGLEKAIELVGGQNPLARAITVAINTPDKTVKQGRIWQWLHRDGKVPAEYCIAIERATGGAVTRHELRPDIYGAPAMEGS